MSDPQSGKTPAHLDDDTSVGAVTQGGHGTRRGNSLWWIAAVIVILAIVAVVWSSTHRGDIVGHGARTVALSAPAMSMPTRRG